MTDNEIDIDALAQEIRRVDGNHSLGHGALAEALAPFIAALSRAIDPKVEVEAVAEQWCAYEDGHQYTGWMPTGYGDRSGWEALARRNPSKYQIVTRPLYASPSIVAPVGVKPLEAELLRLAEKHRWAISPQVGGGWVIETADWHGDDGSEREIARTRKSLVDALRQAVEEELPREHSRLSALTPSEKAGVGDGDVVAASCIARMAADDMIKQNIQWRLDPRYILRLCDAVDAALTPAVGDRDGTAAQIEWLKARLADLQLPAGKRDHDTREKWLLQCGMPDAALSTTKPAQGDAIDVLRGYEAWEADLILNGDWSDGCLRLSHEQHDALIELQTKRNAALAAQGDDAQEGAR
ncbi:hypothetical protein JVX98_13100 [Ensifer sp. PDNC004]|uniref:hypothetical protein n=1 Tax=Ensifer sp. PDNC004 TaxID=2811423 RepID=UPI00196323F5|nr:hypothetical protein [Ensifer sp. PDNC004]QRY69155.1 hypothetical protein JVX98_13100 [Ensifer sp. PDNC004]